jgi:tripartite-type tricarboxylate transporter receptor subunit TctC
LRRRAPCSRRRPDGYTLGLVTNGTSISAAIYKALPFDPVKSFATISTIGSFDLVFATNAESEFKTLQDFIKAAREQPGKLNVGTINVGGTQNLAASCSSRWPGSTSRSSRIAARRMSSLPLLRNDVQMLVEFYAPIKSTLLDNKIRAVATSGTQRSPFFADIPTVAQAGVAGYEVTSWNGLFAPVGTPVEIIDLLNKTVPEIVATPEVKERYATSASKPRPARPSS